MKKRKIFAALFIVLVSATFTFAALKPKSTYNDSGSFKWIFSGTSTQRDAVPDGVWTIAEGDAWWNTDTNTMTVYNGSTWASFTGGGTTLDGAYDYGGAGLGRTIAADTGAVNITVANGDAYSGLTITSAEATTDTDAMVITTTTAGYTGDSLYINGVSGSTDIRADNWSVSQAGAFTIVGATTTGELLVSAADVLFDDTYDVAWDTSRDQFIFQDHAILGLGGDHNAAADITFKYDGTDLLMEAAAANDVWKIGATTNFDINIYGDTATDNVIFDTSAELVSFDGFDISMEDGDLIKFGDSDDFTMTATNTAMTLQTLTTDETSAWNFGADQDGSDIKMFGATASTYAEWDASADELHFILADLKLDTGCQLEFADVDDGTADWTIDLATDERLLFTPSESDDTSTFAIGNATYTSDVEFFGKTASTVTFDASADLQTNVNYDILLNDASTLIFGTGSDFSIFSDTADTLEIDPGGMGDTLKLGTAHGDALNVIWYSDTSGDTVTFDEENVMVEFEDVSLALGDGTKILLGDTIGTGDIEVYATGTELVIDGVVAETGTVSIGLTDLGIDFKLWAATDAEGVLWDASDEALEFTGADLTLNAASTLTVGATVNADTVITTGSFTVTAAMSGKIMVIPNLAGNTTIDLPVEADGLNFEFWYVGGAAEAHDHIIDAEANANFFVGGLQFIDSDDNSITGVYGNGSSESKLTISNMEAGTIIKITCDGTYWFITGIVYSDTAPAFADSV